MINSESPENAAAVFPLTVAPPTKDAALTNEGLALLGTLTTAVPAPFDRLISGMLILFDTDTTAPVFFAMLAAELALFAALITAAWLAAISTECCAAALVPEEVEDTPATSADWRVKHRKESV